MLHLYKKISDLRQRIILRTTKFCLLIVSIIILFNLFLPINNIFACGVCLAETGCANYSECGGYLKNEWRCFEGHWYECCDPWLGCDTCWQDTWCGEVQVWYPKMCCDAPIYSPVNEGGCCGTNGICSDGYCVEAPVVVTPTPNPPPCSNQSVCPSGQDVICSNGNCDSGTSCWCSDPNVPGGGGGCSNAGDCNGTAPCPIGLSGSWYCSSGQCQSFCSKDSGGTPAPPPPPSCTPGATTCGACTLTCGGGNQDCSNGCSNWNQGCNAQSCNGSITGAKVLMPGNISAEPAISQIVYLDGAGPVTDNPYSFTDITATDHTVSVTNPDASHYSVGYTACTNDTTCHSNSPTAGNSATVAVPAGGYVDLYWHFSCTGDAPAAQITPSPINNATLGNTNVTLSWNDASSDWGTFMCPSDTRNNAYTAIYDTSSLFTSPLTACTVNDGLPTTCPALTLSDNTSYWWKVEKSNGPYKDTAGPWKFTVKVPVISGVLFGDINENACYNVASGEQPVLNSPTVTVSGGSSGSSCTTVGANYSCTVPIPSDNTVVSLSSSNFTPIYTSQTGCTSGQDATCSLNNCSITLNAGDTKSVNIGFAVKQWYQANSGSVYSAGDLASYIPNVPLNYDTGAVESKYFVLNTAGPVLTGSANLPDFGPFLGQASLGNYFDRNYSTSLTTDYSFFKTQLDKRATAIGDATSNFTLTNGTLNDGATVKTVTDNSVWDITGNLTVNDANSLDGIKAVFIVSGTVTISGDFKPTLNTSGFAFIAKGNINISSLVTEIRGLYLTDSQFIDGITDNQGLKIVGGVAAKGGLSLQRKVQSYKPAEYFVYDPSLAINLSSRLGFSSYTWQEVAP